MENQLERYELLSLLKGALKADQKGDEPGYTEDCNAVAPDPLAIDFIPY